MPTPDINTQKPAESKTIVSLICAVAFFGMTGGSLIAPTLSTMAGPLNVKPEQVGLILASYTFASALSIPFVGGFLDRWGRKKVLIPCLIGNGLAGLACFYTTDFYLLLVFRFIQGIFIAGLIPAAMTLIGDLYRDLQRVQVMGWMSATTAVGSVTAPMIGGALAYWQWNYPFLFFVLTLPLALLAVLILPPVNTAETRSISDYLRLVGRALQHKKTISVNLMGLIMFFLLYAVVIYIPMLLQDKFGFSPLAAGMALAVQGGAVAIFSLTAKNIRTKIKLHLVFTAGYLLMAAAFILFALVDSIIAVFLLLFVFGSGMGLAQPQLNVLITERSDAEYRGGVVAVFNTLKFVGQTGAPALLGLLLPVIKIPGVFLTSGFLAIATGAYAYLSEK